MAIRHLILSALVSSAFSAHADVIPASAPAQSGLLAGTGDVLHTLGSGDPLGGARSSKLSLVAGISYSAGSSLSSNDLANAVFGAANNNYGAGQNGALSQSKLFFTQGIEGYYLVSSANFVGSTRFGMARPQTFAGAGGPPPSLGIVTKPNLTDIGLPPDELSGGPSGAPVLRVEANAIPEPATGTLMLAGLAGACFFTRRRRPR